MAGAGHYGSRSAGDASLMSEPRRGTWGNQGSPTLLPAIPGCVRAPGDEADQPEHEHDGREDPQEVDCEADPEEQGGKHQSCDQSKHVPSTPFVGSGL